MFEGDMLKKHEEAIEFGEKMDSFVERGDAKDYSEAGLLAELSEDAGEDLNKIEEKIGNIKTCIRRRFSAK